MTGRRPDGAGSAPTSRSGRDASTDRDVELGTDEPDPLVDTLFHEKYRIVRRIGVGGFGKVYEAIDERGAGNRVAIKVLHPERRAELRGATAVLQGRSAARHATQRTRTSSTGRSSTRRRTARPVLRHGTGRRARSSTATHASANDGIGVGPRGEASCSQVTRRAARRAPLVEDRRSILHLDLKPRNVFIVAPRGSREELVKVFDFGIGQFVGGEDEEEVPRTRSTPRPRTCSSSCPTRAPAR